MTVYIALLRAVNVGGTGKLPMSELKTMCEAAGFARVQTYIASGNVVFESTKSTKTVQQALEKRLATYAGKAVGVMVRTSAEMQAILTSNPFPGLATNHTVVIFLNNAPPIKCLVQATGIGNEEMKVGDREIFVHYANGIGRSKLKIPAAQEGTARNINTVTKLVELAQLR